MQVIIYLTCNDKNVMAFRSTFWKRMRRGLFV